MRTLAALSFVLVLGGVASSSLATTYTGSLTYSPSDVDPTDGLYVSGKNWPGYTVSMIWIVTDEDTTYAAYPWKYTYTFEHTGSQAGISHIIIEASPGFLVSEIVGLTGAQLDDSTPVGVQSVGSGNPGMPEDVFGIRFEPLAGDPFTMTWTFYTNRVPVWGDFYVKDGGNPVNIAYNYNWTGGTALGFLDPDNNDTVLDDVDPAGSASSGSPAYHILRPDSKVEPPSDPTQPPIPEPVTVFSLAGALGCLGMYVRRRRR